MKAALYGDIVEHSDFELNLRPPGTLLLLLFSIGLNLFAVFHLAEQSTEQIREEIDSITKVLILFV